MEYIYQDEDGGWQIEPYFAYIASVADRMPPNAQRFVLNRDHFALFPRNSLHDAWVEAVVIREPAVGDRLEQRTIEIELQLLGAYHDGRIWLTYQQVQSYVLSTPVEFPLPPSGTVGHGDLLIHEVRLTEAGFIVHEILFSRGSTMVIECADLVHTEARITMSTPNDEE